MVYESMSGGEDMTVCSIGGDESCQLMGRWCCWMKSFSRRGAFVSASYGSQVFSCERYPSHLMRNSKSWGLDDMSNCCGRVSLGRYRGWLRRRRAWRMLSTSY